MLDSWPNVLLLSYIYFLFADPVPDATLLGLDESTQQSTGSNMLGLDESTQQSTGSNSNHVIPKFEQEDSNMSFPDNSMDSEFKYG